MVTIKIQPAVGLWKKNKNYKYAASLTEASLTKQLDSPIGLLQAGTCTNESCITLLWYVTLSISHNKDRIFQLTTSFIEHEQMIIAIIPRKLYRVLQCYKYRSYTYVHIIYIYSPGSHIIKGQYKLYCHTTSQYQY